MAAETITDASVTLGGVDVSDHVKSVTLNRTVDEQETTAMGDTYRTRIAGTQDLQIDVEWYMDYAAGDTYATIEPLVATVASFSIRKESGVAATTNPQWDFQVLVTEFPYIAANHGQVHMFSTSWPGSDADGITIATS